MIKTKLISNHTSNNIDEIKVAALYFDKIEIVNNRLYQIEPVPDEEQNEEKNIGIIKGITNFITDDYHQHIQILLNEGIADIIPGIDSSNDKLWDFVDETAKKFLYSNLGIIFKESQIKNYKSGKKKSSKIYLSDEAKLIHSDFVGPIEIGNKLDLDFIIKYYSTLLSSLFYHISKGEQCITSSNILNDFLKYYVEDPQVIKLKQEPV